MSHGSVGRGGLGGAQVPQHPTSGPLSKLFGVTDDKLIVVRDGVEYRVSIKTFANVAPLFFQTFEAYRSARSIGPAAAIGPLQWLWWGVLGLFHDEDPEQATNLKLSLHEIEAIGDALYVAAIERGLKP